MRTLFKTTAATTTTTKTTIHSSLGRIRNFLCTREMLLSHAIHRLKTSILQQFTSRQKFKLSDIGEGIDEVVLKEWHVRVDDFVEEFDSICDVQSDKALVTISSRYRGKITKLYYNVEDVIKIGSSLIDVQIDAVASESIPNRTKILASPAVRKLIKDNTIDSKTIIGSGADGRILKADVLKQIEPSAIRTSVENAQTSGIQPLTSIQKAMAKKMTAALSIPHFVYSDEINVTKLIEMRNELSDSLDSKFTLMPLFLKALSNALRKYPILNSSVDANCENIHLKNEHNIGIASDTKVGLVVPVIRNVQNLSIFEISESLNHFRELSANNKWSNYDLSDGTITFSNIGNIGGTYLKPIILPPQVAIGAIGRIYKKNEQSFLNVSWSADHRVLDGATVAKFSNLWKKQLENPVLLISSYYQRF